MDVYEWPQRQGEAAAPTASSFCLSSSSTSPARKYTCTCFTNIVCFYENFDNNFLTKCCIYKVFGGELFCNCSDCNFAFQFFFLNMLCYKMDSTFIVWLYETFDNNSLINVDFTKYLEESYWRCSGQHLAFNSFP